MKRFADCHIHIQVKPFEIVSAMLNDVASMGITDACLLALPFRSVAQNLAVLYQKMTYKKIKLRAFGGLHSTDRYASVPYEKQAGRMLDMGFDGIKLMDMNPLVRRFNGRGVNHSAYDKMFAMLEERGTPMLMHANDPHEYWVSPDNHTGKGEYTLPEYETYETIHRETLEMLRKFPKLNITLAHFFFLGHDLEKAAWFLDSFPNVKLDLTPGTEMYHQFAQRIEDWHDFFGKYRDRILFGTDSSTAKDFNKGINRLVYTTLAHDHSEFTMPCYGGYQIRGLGLEEAVLDRICYENFIDFVGEEIAPVDEEAFYAAVEYILGEMRTHPQDPVYDAISEIFPYLRKDPKQEIALTCFESILAARKK